ncbi:spermatogenesis-associated protein 31D1-like [Lutra lutra]|uniref:spermatogenesis-associated protein 31D1-like n=1 Tax=Lutra lutra TaxID=9657 RepID=UPI001FD238B7|nr:spermatogenesis-associated protein 31D1-like [Lutra lutra]XP_047587938.1 spermatogenesis-associated protein 31D1-like [Lutra lutra]
MRATRYIPSQKTEASEERLMDMQPECKTLLRFPALTTTEHEAVMDLDNECCPVGGRYCLCFYFHYITHSPGFPDDRWHRREVDDTRKLISVLRSPLSRHHDTIHFRQLLCPDPSCEVCNSTTAEINQLLFLQALEDSTPLASTAPVTSSSFTLSPDFSAVPPGDLISAPLPKPSPPPASIFSPNPVIPVADFFPPSPPGDSLPPKPFPPLDSKFPRDHVPPQPLAFPPVQPHHAHTVGRSVRTETVSLSTTFSLDPTLSQDVSPLPELSQKVNPTETFARHHAPPTRSASPPPGCDLTAPQSTPISISRKPVPQSSPPDSSGGLSSYVPTILGIDPSSLSILDLPWWQTHAKGFFPSTLAPRDFHQEVLALHSSEASSRGSPAANLVEPGNLSLLSPDALALLEKQMQKRSDFLLWKESKGSFAKQTIVDAHDLASSLPFWSSKDQSKELHMHQQCPYPTTLEEGHLQQTPIQLFWGLQTPPRESSFPAADASDHISNASPEQESPVVPHPLPPSLPESPPQLLPQAQPLPSPRVQPQAHLPSPLPILPSGPLPDIKICGVCFHRPRNELENLTPTEMQHLEWNVLQKVQTRVWGLPPVVQRSQEDYCPSAPNPSLSHKATEAQVVISVPAGQFPLNEELRRKLESHLRKRLIQHRWGIPRRIYESLALMSHLSTLPQLPESQRFRGHSWIPKSLSKSNDTESVNDKDSEMLQLEDGELDKDNDNLKKGQEHNPENGPKDHLLSDLESSSDNDMGHDSEKELRSPSENSSTGSVETAGPRQLENVLKTHLRKKSEEISEGHVPGTVHHSWHTMKQTSLPSEKSQTEIKQRRLPPSEVEDYSLNTCKELPFVEPRVQQMLEAHIKRFRWRMLWGLPSRVLESIEIFKSRKATSPCSPPCSTKLIPAANSKPGAFNPLRESLKSLHADKAGTANSAPILDHPHPATSTVGKEEQRIPRQSSSNINHQLVEDVPKTKHGRRTLKPVKHVTIANRWPPKPPARQ